VLVSAQPPEHVLDRLRAIGHAPLAEPGAGLAAPVVRRAQGRTGHADAAPGPAVVTPALAAAAVRAMRASDRGPRPRVEPAGGDEGHPIPTGSHGEVVAALRSAIAAESTLWIGYADPNGTARDRRVEPLRLVGGYLTALDLRTESIQSFALARITGVQRA
jgi:predicted DNA-binding transcriptional regulator YafY